MGVTPTGIFHLELANAVEQHKRRINLSAFFIDSLCSLIKWLLKHISLRKRKISCRMMYLDLDKTYDSDQEADKFSI